ncbi:MAG: hypothetical protein SWH54_17605 [Thermodesulfobacteriota bacterium]|nr:hypothetical protein [Thermodesulfobacteriota bacterium]
MKSAIWMPAFGILILMVTYRWWFRDLIVPKTLGRWLLATFYMVFIGALWFIGIAFDMGKMPSVAGMAFIFAVLFGLWIFTGLPMAIFGAFNSIESHRIRRSYAYKHGLIYQEYRVEKKLIPKAAGLFRSRLTNILRISENSYIATTLRYISDADTSFFRGSEFIAVEKIPVNGTVVALHDPAQKPTSSQPEVLEFEDKIFRVVSAKNIQIADRIIEAKDPLFTAARKMVQSILQTIADPSPEILKQLKVIYLFDRGIVLELDYLTTESKLNEWVKCVKRLAGWSPPTLIVDENPS